MTDNPSDDRFSMPPLEGVWDGDRADESPAEEPQETSSTRVQGLKLPPPGLFARLDDGEPEEMALEDEPESHEVDDLDHPVEIEDHDVQPTDEAPARTGLSGVADAIDIVEQLAARSAPAPDNEDSPSGDELVMADAADGIAADSVDADEDEDENENDIRSYPLPAYALGRSDPDEITGTVEPAAAVALPMYGSDSVDDAEILPHFLLEEAAPLDVVGAQEQLREMAQKNRRKAKVADEHKPSLARTLAEIPVLLIVAAVIAFLVKTFLAQAYYIPSGSMIPQLQIDDRVVVSKLAYKLHDPRRGDIIVFDDPKTGGDTEAAPERSGVGKVLRKVGEGVGVVQPSTDEFIKRVIGLPGDSVAGHDGYVYINDHKLIEPYLPVGLETGDFPAQTIAKDKLWVMGDNRGGSADSRFFGQIDIDSIVGRAVVKVWPFSHISFL